ncbi:MAG: hypothetical protein HY308_02085 [Gammaproteobacteria bacterium]|nr:hypothetical protein [Gammaproteobacteria bacterium]
MRLRHLCAIFLLYFSSTALAAETLQIFQLRNRPAEELAPLIQPLLQPNEGMSGSGYQLFIRADESRRSEIQRLINALDVARRQLRITVRQTVARDTDTTDLGVSGDAGNDRARVHIPRTTPERNGVIIKRNGVRIDSGTTQTTQRDDVTQFVTTLDGAHAFVRVGQSVPHVSRILTLTGHQTVLQQGVVLQDVITGFDVVPRVQGERIQLEITPRLARLANPSTGLVDFQEYATTVLVKPGEWIDIGGLSGNGADVRRAILESATTQTSERRTILLKAE